MDNLVEKNIYNFYNLHKYPVHPTHKPIYLHNKKDESKKTSVQ